MRIVAIMPVRNEDWILSLSARVALQWCDTLILGMHACTDRSLDIAREIEREFPGRVGIVVEHMDDPDWREMDHRQMLLDCARAAGATHVALVDCDELIQGDSLPNIRSWAEALMPGECLNVRMRSMWRGMDRYRVDPCVWSDRRDLSLVFRDSPNLTWKPQGNGYQHHSRKPHGCTVVWSSVGDSRTRNKQVGKPDLGVMHCQWASWRRVVAKHDLYRVREMLMGIHPIDWINKTYGLALDETGLKTEPTPREWLEPYAQWMHHLKLDAPVWFEDEVKRLIAEHGRERFAGLDIRTA